MDRNEAIEALTKMLDCEDIDFCDSDCFKCRLFTKAVDRSNALIMAIKALEQAKIIHCKECKYWKEKPLYTYCERMYHMGFAEFFDYTVEENDFCSWAEKRGEAE